MSATSRLSGFRSNGLNTMNRSFSSRSNIYTLIDLNNDEVNLIQRVSGSSSRPSQQSGVNRAGMRSNIHTLRDLPFSDENSVSESRRLKQLSHKVEVATEMLDKITQARELKERNLNALLQSTQNSRYSDADINAVLEHSKAIRKEAEKGLGTSIYETIFLSMVGIFNCVKKKCFDCFFFIFNLFKG